MLKVFKGNKGVTLLEILLAVAILTIASLPLMSFIPSSAKITFKTQEELELNQELRTTINKITDVIKNPSKKLDLSDGIDSKNINQITNNIDVVTGEFTSNDKFKIPGSSSTFMINGKKETKKGEPSAAAMVFSEYPVSVPLTGGGLGLSADNYEAIDYNVYLYNSGSKDIELKDLSFEYICNITIVNHPSQKGTDKFMLSELSNFQPNTFFPLYFECDPISGAHISSRMLYASDVLYTFRELVGDPRGNGCITFSFNPSIDLKIKPKSYLEFHPGIKIPGRYFDLTNDYSFITNQSTNNDTDYPPAVKSIENTKYHKWPQLPVLVNGVNIADPTGEGNSFLYETNLYTIKIQLFNNKDVKVKEALVMISGNKD